MEIFKKNKFAFLAAGLTLALMMILYYPLFLSPNSYVFAPGGDGLRNYYAFIYHGKFDQGFWDFSGMNYPYGENIVYTDAHPLLSYLVGLFGLTNYAVGILNLTMLLSFPLCSYYIFKILSHFKVETKWAIAGAVAIGLLSPQVQRLTGHTSLSYAFAIPILWWFMIQFRETSKLKWSIYIFLLITIFFYTHPYLGMIMISFLTASLLVHLLFEKKDRLKSIAHYLLQGIVPLVLFRVLLGLNDTHVNRMGEPAGFFNYYATWKSFIYPYFGPIGKLREMLGLNSGNWESWNYLGFGTLIMFFIILGYGIAKRKSICLRAIFSSSLSKYIIAASLILMFAFCFPLKFDWSKWVTEYFGTLKQFRVLGRFGWVFFYVITISVIIVFYQIRLKSEKKIVFDSLFYVFMIFTIIEVYPVHKYISDVASTSPNYFKEEVLDEDMRELVEFAQTGEYDAIILLPFTHLSSENVMLLGSEEANKNSYIISYHSGLPLVNSVSGRMSLDEAIKFNNFFGPEFIYKDLVNDIPADSKILLVKDTEKVHKREQKLLWSQEKIFENNSFRGFTLDLKTYNNPLYYNLLLSQSENDSIQEDYYLNSFGGGEEFVFSGEGSYQAIKDGWHVLDTITRNEIDATKCISSIWYYLGVNRPDMVFNCELLYPDSTVTAGDFDIKQSTHIVENWCLAEIEFEFPEDCPMARFSIVGNGSGEPFYVDELMIYPDTAKIFSSESINGTEYMLYNNYRVPDWPE